MARGNLFSAYSHKSKVLNQNKLKLHKMQELRLTKFVGIRLAVVVMQIEKTELHNLSQYCLATNFQIIED